jgi:hypothetical protein
MSKKSQILAQKIKNSYSGFVAGAGICSLWGGLGRQSYPGVIYSVSGSITEVQIYLINRI